VNQAELIGIPFEYGGRTLKGLDCFGLIMKLLEGDGVNVHDFGWNKDSAIIQTMMLAAREGQHWVPCKPQKGAIILFRVGRYVRHVAYMLDRNKFIHCWERSNGVVVERINEDWQNRIVGIYKYVE
jgi:lipoprotein Spr